MDQNPTDTDTRIDDRSPGFERDRVTPAWWSWFGFVWLLVARVFFVVAPVWVLLPRDDTSLFQCFLVPFAFYFWALVASSPPARFVSYSHDTATLELSGLFKRWRITPATSMGVKGGFGVWAPLDGRVRVRISRWRSIEVFVPAEVAKAMIECYPRDRGIF